MLVGTPFSVSLEFRDVSSGRSADACLPEATPPEEGERLIRYECVSMHSAKNRFRPLRLRRNVMQAHWLPPVDFSPAR